MSTMPRAPQILKLESPLLSVAAVQQVARQVAALRKDDASFVVVLDCHVISSITVHGLRALLTLPERSRHMRWVITGAQPALLRAALQVGLAAHYELWTSHASFLQAHAEPA
jgi:hypothetical protein